MKTCTAIPVHSAKYNFATVAMESYYKNNNNNDLYFIYSNCSEEKKFLNKNSKLKSIIADKQNPKNIITYKKLFGLEKLFVEDNYDYVGIFDCDVEFVRNFNPDEIYPKIFQDNFLKSNYSSGAADLVKRCATYMGLQSNKKLIEKTKNYSVYWWFNEICVFEKHTFVEFHEWIKKSNYAAILEDRKCFDHIMYGIWLVCFKDYDVKIMNDKVYSCSALEHNFFDNDLSKTYMSYADANTNYKNLEHIKVRIHVDRAVNPHNWG